jgi:flagellar basal-body rod protein FlgG
MIQSLYTGATGMQAQQLNLDTIANNLANANTTGFKKNMIEFEDLLYQTPRAVGTDAGSGTLVPTGVQVGNGSRVVSTAKDFTQGQLVQTGQNYDMAISGDGFFVVQQPDGTQAYTRDGSLKVDGTGHLVTSDGMQVLSNFQSIPSGTTSFTVAANGQVTMQSSNGGSQTYQVQLVRFANPGGLQNVGGNLYIETPASGQAESGNPGTNGYGSITQGYLESSNVNIVEEMVNMIQAQRAYEINSKAIQTSDEMLSQISQLQR